MGPNLRFIIKSTLEVLLYPFRLFPIKEKKVFLLNDLMAVDADYSSNPKYIAEYLIENEPEYEVYYALGAARYKEWKNDKSIYPSQIKFVKLRSISYFFHALTAKVFITTSGGISYMPFRKEQLVINSWHGGGAYKKMGLDAANDESLHKALIMSESKTDYFISSNKYFSEAVMSAFLMPKDKIIEIGLPRNDVFFKNGEFKNIKAKVYSIYDINEDDNIVLYAPTYRSADESIFKEHVLGPYDINYDLVLEALEDKFGGKWKFAIRLHPSLRGIPMSLPDNVIDMSDYEDPQELMVAANVLINDYSSTMWDFALTYKPCFLYTPDLSSYDSKLGFYTEPSSWPFSISTSNEELIEHISQFNCEKYEESLDEYFKWMGSFESGTAVENLVNVFKNGEIKNDV